MRITILALLLLFVGALRSQAQVTVGYGVQVGPPHYAQLAWVASTTTGVLSYNIYRSEVSGSGYKVITNVAATGQQFQSYQDQGLPAGKTYFYVVTAVTATGESAFSNQGTAVIPTP